jgi:RNA polymerase sigma-70 factor, ECF subfamily
MFANARAPTAPVEPDTSPWFVEAVEQARQGNTSAFDVLYQHFYAPIRLYLAHMVGDDEEGYDLAQETFLKAWKSLASIQNEARFDTWLYRIATNTAIDYLRRRKFRWPRWKQSEEENLPEYMYVSGPEEQVGEAEHIQQALGYVSLKYRSCLLLQLVANLPQREIARSLNIGEKSVSIYVSRGCEQFRRAYQRLSQANSKSLKEKGEVNEINARPGTHPLYRLGAETYGQAPG